MHGVDTAPLMVTAMPSEARHALHASGASTRRQLGPWPLWSLSIDGRSVHLLLTGIGMVNAGAALARSLAGLHPRAILNFGCAGAHRQDVIPGDVVIGDRYVHHRSVIILPDGIERYSGMPVEPEDTMCFIPAIQADPTLLTAGNDASRDWTPDPWPASEDDARQPTVFVGPIASGDTWTQSISHIERFRGEHDTLCEDMEAAALAQIASMHRLPFLAVKDISNNEFLTATEHGDVGPSLKAVEAEVGRRAFDLTRCILGRLPDE